MSPATSILSAQEIAQCLEQLANQLCPVHENLVLVGIVTRGEHLANRLNALLVAKGLAPVPVGRLDITLYRDDPGQVFKATQHSHIPVNITNKHVVLVDDVLFHGRTIRAALDALYDYGRPTWVKLLVLVDRGHRQLPISADFVGTQLTTHLQERIDVKLQETDGYDEVLRLPSV